ncbi:hypothetical protein EV663_10576 [Rhodovulum bhavnagarense]|uniref:Flagellar assembly T-like protein n=1 Tax=Rhodovulum bhavnagarense TaxID=992286 RepID=A0A4R2RFS0_9RHOB|nr:hypothetical protein [Rhodovulum bhavnagarense]TCP61358.1 hypothetical protein EV663_10576 [Rhodovulum bhavnagarense]
MCRHVRGILLFCLIACATPAALASSAGRDGAIWVEAEGFGTIAGGADSDSARRNALAEALIAAGLSGGVKMSGYTAIDKAAVTADLAILRASAEIVEHRVIAAERSHDTWRVKVRARVAPRPLGACPARRRLDILAYAPEFVVAPTAPAWSVPLAQDIWTDLQTTLEAHPRARLTRVTDRPYSAQLSSARAGFDYDTLTRGAVPRGGGEHALLTRIEVQPLPRRELALSISMTLRDARRDEASVTITRRVRQPMRGDLGAAIGPRRASMVQDLTQGIDAAAAGLLDRMACRAPAARLEIAGEALIVPLGSANGITRSSLGFVEGNDRFGVLEIVRLDRERTVLRPLDRSRPLGAFAERDVTFLETGG